MGRVAGQWTAAVALMLVAPTTGTATIVRVPDDQPTIQAGLDAASHGDTVLVASGVYYERVVLDADDSGVVLASVAGADSTFIDGTGTVGRSLVVFEECDEHAVLTGFTMRNHGGSPGYPGGGIRCISSHPVIRDNIIEDCRVAVLGGGIYLEESNAYVVSNTVRRNTAGEGGGIHIYGGSPTIEENEIVDNTAMHFDFYWGGGIYVSGGSATIVANRISRNESVWGGGGIHVCCGAGGLVADNTITANVAAAGGAIETSDCTTVFQGNIVVDNRAHHWGSALYSYGVFSEGPVFEANIMCGNSDTKGALAFGGASFATFRGNSLGGNSPREVWIRSSAAAGTLDMTGNWWGTSDPDSIEHLIHDCWDDPGLDMCIDFSAWCLDPSCSGQVTSVPDGGSTSPVSWGRLKAGFK